jgi:branched-chain amino acid transport system substrate-binding protein
MKARSRDPENREEQNMIEVTRRRMLTGIIAAGAAVAMPRALRAQSKGLRIGVLTDLSGPYRDNGGPTAVACAQQAVEDFGAAGKGLAVEIIAADHQNKTDAGLNIARQWFDRDGVDAIVEVNQSALALALNAMVREKNKVHLNTGAATADLTGSKRSPNMVHWQTDSYCRAHATSEPLLKTGGDAWYFITADYAFGHSVQRSTEEAIKAAGGTIKGASVYPFPATTDFSSYLLAAQSSGANIIGLCNSSADFINCVKQSQEFGITASGMRLAGMVTFLPDIHALGLPAAQGLILTEPFYWNLNDRTRAFLNRVKSKTPTNYPSSEHAGTYGAVLHYLKAATAIGVDRAKASGLEAVETMKRLPTDDDCFGPGTIRQDGRKLHPTYLFQVKAPDESTGAWDYYKVISTIPAENAFRPLAEGGCAFIHT